MSMPAWTSVRVTPGIASRSSRAMVSRRPSSARATVAMAGDATEHSHSCLAVAALEVDDQVPVGRDLADRALHEDAAAVDDRGRIADLLDLIQQVRGKEDCPALADQVADEAAELEDAARIEAVGRRVEASQLPGRRAGTGDTQPLRHITSTGKPRGRPRDRALPSARARRRCARRRPCPARRRRSRDSRDPSGARGSLAPRRSHRPGPAHLLEARDENPEHLHRSCAGRSQAEQRADEGGLASAVRPQETERATARPAGIW